METKYIPIFMFHCAFSNRKIQDSKLPQGLFLIAQYFTDIKEIRCFGISLESMQHKTSFTNSRLKEWHMSWKQAESINGETFTTFSHPPLQCKMFTCNQILVWPQGLRHCSYSVFLLLINDAIPLVGVRFEKFNTAFNPLPRR